VLLTDVNVLVHAFREDAPTHREQRQWLEDLVNGDEAFGYSDSVLSGFIRIVTHPRLFRTPSPLDAALTFTSEIRAQPHAVALAPGPRHWDIFVRLCRQVDARGNLVPDAFLAALAIESGSEFITTDHDFARFRGLRWRHPLETP